MSDNTVYLMRGLPCSGKSHTARRLAADTGIVLETDEYFLRHVGDDPTRYDYDEKSLPNARQWSFDRFVRAIADGISPIVVDRGNDASHESYRYAKHAVDNGYRVELREPDSTWWQEIRVLLKYRPDTQRPLYDWANRLAEMGSAHHRVPASLIRRGMDQ